MPTGVPVALVIGFIAGVLVNLIADYLPARRHRWLASTNPFVSQSVIPPKPTFLPRREDGSLYPPYLWSGVISALLQVPVFKQYRVRHVVTEISLALGVAANVWIFADVHNMPFLPFYGAVFVLIAIIDIEHRWVFLEIIVPTALVALAEPYYGFRVWNQDSWRGGLYGFGIMLAVYLFGLIFARVVGLVTGKRITRTVFGFGDVYIGTLGGLIIGWNSLGLALLVMVLTGAIASLVLILGKLLRTRRYRLFSAIPYGPYILIGMASMLYFPQYVGLIARWLIGWA